MAAKPMILVVDDDVRNLKSMEALLSELDADATYVESGQAALQFVLRNPVSVILLDVQMPNMDGFEVAELIRQNKITADIPIIFLTAIGNDKHHAFRGYESGCVDFISKPVESVILLSKLKVFLDLARSKIALEQSLEDMKALQMANEMIIEAAAGGIISIAPDGQVNLANKAALDLFEIDSKDNKTISDFLHDEISATNIMSEALLHQTTKGTVVIKQSTGKERVIHYSANPLFVTKNHFSGLVLVAHDMTEVHKKAIYLKNLSESDALTKLGNRRMFENVLDLAVDKFNQCGESFILLFIDLDKFKQVNDTYGHEAGDNILVHVANCLKNNLRANDIACRLGGDEFALIISSNNNALVASKLASRLIDDISTEIDVNGHAVNVGACIGIATCPEHAVTSKGLLNLADAAMYQAKAKGGNQFVFSEEQSSDFLDAEIIKNVS